ncbi:GNAT family N-acetyltransferase [Aquimarina agarilytica]|uniref:GNAT family N-acetyltransferase n=1 Tax=Aquimarina agarilytica TaxID=1087449 RepID=UPI000287E473|nr:GNAT family N-acetyltransferase [Aquimarina agarilytica]
MKARLVDNDADLHQILAIQKENHLDNVSISNKKERGFVTVKHDFEVLKKLNSKARQIIVSDKNEVIGYALVMLKEFKDLIPVLIPMFTLFESIQYRGKKLSELNYYVMGQICIADGYKRKGLFEKLYLKHKEVYSEQFEYCITEVSSSNIPSMKAHEKVGFKTISTFCDTTDEWNVLLWDWH